MTAASFCIALSLSVTLSPLPFLAVCHPTANSCAPFLATTRPSDTLADAFDSLTGRMSTFFQPDVLGLVRHVLLPPSTRRRRQRQGVALVIKRVGAREYREHDALVAALREEYEQVSAMIVSGHPCHNFYFPRGIMIVTVTVLRALLVCVCVVPATENVNHIGKRNRWFMHACIHMHTHARTHAHACVHALVRT